MYGGAFFIWEWESNRRRRDPLTDAASCTRERAADAKLPDDPDWNQLPRSDRSWAIDDKLTAYEVTEIDLSLGNLSDAVVLMYEPRVPGTAAGKGGVPYD